MSNPFSASSSSEQPLRILMLGWEFPPVIAGGLGTACYGLTKALSRRQTHITFVLPRPPAAFTAEHLRILSPREAESHGPFAGGWAPPLPLQRVYSGVSQQAARDFANVAFQLLPCAITSPYAGPAVHPTLAGNPNASVRSFILSGPGPYSGDLLAQVRHYATLCLQLCRLQDFDVIHAHDWLTFPAGLALSAASGKPLVIHVHSTEVDRAIDRPLDDAIFAIEQRGMQRADRVIAVSHLTATIVRERYQINPAKIDVVYNGVECPLRSPEPADHHLSKADKVVLFLGRVTAQKGPQYFIQAAKLVLSRYPRVKFVIAGSGDQITQIIDLALAQGIAHRVLFTGFLDRQQVHRVFRMADVYVMPSVSEPFGISALEALSHNLPVIISRSSGVSEVLRHALKVDFWDVADLADKILALLRHPPLGVTLRRNADAEVRKLTWDDAADHTLAVYERALRPDQNPAHWAGE